MDKGRILVVDDDPVVSLSFKRMLGAEGFDTLTIDRGLDALRMLERENFDLLISDIRLPDISGMTVLKEAKAVYPDMDVVIITGYPTLEDAKDSIRLGAIEYIEKPFTPEYMINVTKRVFDKRTWTLRKAFIEEFRDYIVALSDTSVVYHKDGVWTRPLKDGLLEVGCDARYYLLGGDLLYIDFIKDIEVIKAGEPFARLLTSTGRIIDLHCPVNGRITEINSKANDVVVALSKVCLSDGWLLKLAKVLH